jgi:hypothetical protein
MNDSRCKKTVYPNEQWGAFHPHQCNRKVWKDEYCKQHHPDTVKERRDKRNKVWEEKFKTMKDADRRFRAMVKACESVDTNTLEKISVQDLLYNLKILLNKDGT